MKKICYVVTKSITIKAFFIQQLKYLADNGYDVSVICSPDSELVDLLGEKVRFIPVYMPRGFSFFGSLKTIFALKKVFKKERFDLVQYSTPNAAFYSSIAAKSAKIKIRNYHLMGFRFLGATGLKRIILKRIEKKTCKKSTHIECVSKSNFQIGINHNLFAKEKATVIWNGSSGGVDLGRFNIENAQTWRIEKRAEIDIDQNEFVYGFVGRITKDKGIEELITAFEKVSKSIKSKLVIVGNLDQNHGLSQSVLSKIDDNKNIIKINHVVDVEKYYPIFDVLVLPSYREGFGNVIIEAQAMGVPVIASKIPGPMDAMVDKMTGLLFEKKDVNELVVAMEQAVNFNDSGYCKNAHEYVKQNFDSEILCKHILERKKTLLEN